MALEKSQLYSPLWQSYDELRGDMDASQYKGSSSHRLPPPLSPARP